MRTPHHILPRLAARLLICATPFAVLLFPLGARAQCPQPVNLSVTNTGCTVALSWQNTPGAPAPVFWSVFRGLQSNGSDAALITSTSPSLFSYTDIPPARGVTYYYYIRGAVLNGPCLTANLNSAILPGKLLSVPISGLGVQSQNCSSITIRWDAFPDAQSFSILRQEVGASGGSVIGTAPAGSTTYTDSTAAPGQSYFYGVEPNTPCVPNPSTGGVQVTMYRAVQADAAPVSAVRNVGESVTFNFNFSGAVPGVNTFFGIRKDGFNLPTNPRIFYGVNQSSITITNIQPEDEGEYVSTLGNACGTATQRAVLAVRNPCRADFNASGTATVQDVFDFLTAWFSGCP